MIPCANNDTRSGSGRVGLWLLADRQPIVLQPTLQLKTLSKYRKQKHNNCTLEYLSCLRWRQLNEKLIDCHLPTATGGTDAAMDFYSRYRGLVDGGVHFGVDMSHIIS